VDSFLLELQAPRRLGVACESPNISCGRTQEVCITRSFEQSLVSDLTWIFVVGEGRIRVEEYPALCERLNEEVGHLGGVTEPQLKSCVLCAFVDVILSLIISYL
jgi:hypothetical protein